MSEWTDVVTAVGTGVAGIAGAVAAIAAWRSAEASRQASVDVKDALATSIRPELEIVASQLVNYTPWAASNVTVVVQREKRTLTTEIPYIEGKPAFSATGEPGKAEFDMGERADGALIRLTCSFSDEHDVARYEKAMDFRTNAVSSRRIR